MYNIHPTDFLIFSFDREVSQSKVLFQCPQSKILHVVITVLTAIATTFGVTSCI